MPFIAVKHLAVLISDTLIVPTATSTSTLTTTSTATSIIVVAHLGELLQLPLLIPIFFVAILMLVAARIFLLFRVHYGEAALEGVFWWVNSALVLIHRRGGHPWL